MRFYSPNKKQAANLISNNGVFRVIVGQWVFSPLLEITKSVQTFVGGHKKTCEHYIQLLGVGIFKEVSVWGSVRKKVFAISG